MGPSWSTTSLVQGGGLICVGHVRDDADALNSERSKLGSRGVEGVLGAPADGDVDAFARQ